MALYRLAVVVDQQQAPDSDAEYQRLMDRILAVQPNNLFILQSKLRVALRRGDRAAAREAVERLKPLAAKWSPQSEKTTCGSGCRHWPIRQPRSIWGRHCR